MTSFQAFVLGILQGLTEFLPVSSSAHLALAPWLFGWLAETRSTSFAFAMCAIGMLAALTCIVLIRKLVSRAEAPAH